MTEQILVNEEDTQSILEKKYLKIGEAALFLGVRPHVLRYWESEFPQIKPVKSRTGQRLYRRQDVETLQQIQKLLYERKFTIAGAKKALRVKDIECEENEVPTTTELQTLTNEINHEVIRDNLLRARGDLEQILKRLEQTPIFTSVPLSDDL